MHLRLDLHSAYDCGRTENAQSIMRDLGITYQVSTPQSIADQWWFWNCENVEKDLPKYLTKLELDPMKCIGRGLSKKEAENIRDYNGNT